MNRRLFFVAIALLAGTLCSCERENYATNSNNNGKVGVIVSASGGVATKAGKQVELIGSTLLEDIDGQDFRLDAYVEDNDMMPFTRELATKGSIVTTEDINTEGQTFAFNGWLRSTNRYPNAGSAGRVNVEADATNYHFVNTTVTKGSTQWDLAQEAYWRNAVPTTFWSYYPVEDNARVLSLPGQTPTDAQQDAFSFTYTTPESVADQKDILFAYNQHTVTYDDKGRTEDSESVDIDFYHALAAIRFDVSGIKNTVISKVTFDNIAVAGTCNVSGGETADGGKSPGTVTFAWTPGTTGSRSQDLAPEDFTETGLDGETENALMPLSSGKFFFFIPQQIEGNGVKVTVTFMNSGEEVTKTVDLNHDVAWEAGKIYTYKLSYIEPVFDFELETPSQSSLVYINTVSPETRPVGIVSTKNSTIPVNWKIKSYKIGTGDPVSVDGATFTDGGLTVLNDAGTLMVTAAARTLVNQGTHDYWVNNPARTDDLDWSPADWSGSEATASSPLDLSKFDFKNESARGTMTTANCYIVRHSGTYKIPLVYGNGIVDGSINTRSYAPVLSGNIYSLTPLVNYLNEGISSPFIENNANCVPTGCAVLWQDEAVVVKDLSIIGDTKASYDASSVRYLKFTVDPSTVCQNNAVICIYKDLDGDSEYDSGEAIWSWHIWTTNNPDLLSDAIPVTNHSGKVYNFFPLYNLGYIDGINYPGRKTVIVTLEQNGTGNTIDITVNQPIVITQSTGNYYQFGRKDPMCRKDTPASGAFYIKDASLTDIYVNKAITEPDTFYGCTPYDGVTGWHTWAWPNSNLWSGAKATYNTSYENDSDLFKTIYDPSPVGYKIPASKAFTGFTTTGEGTSTVSEYNVSSFSNGYYFYTNSTKSDVILFPASGYRHSQTGAITDVGGRGSYWSAISGNESSGYQLLFFHGDGNGIVPDNFERRANGQSVRPVKE